QTAPNHRRRGCGRAAVTAWAGAIQKNGKVPFYSYSEENVASAALLRSLGGEEFARVVAFA
ncbi:MAG TPA: GNAT family N-acetyltransferase, partial [Chloroflexota bacterium]|nr:GNAT family N-acetyltransferase [Chloroflexota bacterium]